MKRWVQESPLFVQPLITAGPTLLSQGTLTCRHGGREHLGREAPGPVDQEQETGLAGLAGGSRGTGTAPPPPLWSTVAPSWPPCWVGRGVCCMGSSEWEAGGKVVSLEEAEMVPVGEPLFWSEPRSLSPQHWGLALLGL